MLHSLHSNIAQPPFLFDKFLLALVFLLFNQKRRTLTWSLQLPRFCIPPLLLLFLLPALQLYHSITQDACARLSLVLGRLSLAHQLPALHRHAQQRHGLGAN